MSFLREFFTKIHFISVKNILRQTRDKLLPNQHEVGNSIVNKFLIISTTNLILKGVIFVPMYDKSKLMENLVIFVIRI